MAKPSWLTVSPMSGSGNGVLQNTGAAHTGRNVRTGTVTVTATGVAQPKTYKVTQEAKPEFISIDNGADMAADKAGGKVTVTGKSNSAKLAFSWVGEAHSGTIAAAYTAGGTSTDNGEAIDGDPGASAEYNWSVELTLPANETVEQVAEEDERRGDPGEEHEGADGDGSDEDGEHGAALFKVDVLEARVDDAAHHQQGDDGHADGHHDLPGLGDDEVALGGQVDDEVEVLVREGDIDDLGADGSQELFERRSEQTHDEIHRPACERGVVNALVKPSGLVSSLRSARPLLSAPPPPPLPPPSGRPVFPPRPPDIPLESP